MSNNELKKMIVFTNTDIKDLMHKCVSIEAHERNISESKVLEEYILSGIARSFPNEKEKISNIYKTRYKKYIDKHLMD